MTRAAGTGIGSPAYLVHGARAFSFMGSPSPPLPHPSLKLYTTLPGYACAVLAGRASVACRAALPHSLALASDSTSTRSLSLSLFHTTTTVGSRSGRCRHWTPRHYDVFKYSSTNYRVFVVWSASISKLSVNPLLCKWNRFLRNPEWSRGQRNKCLFWSSGRHQRG